MECTLSSISNRTQGFDFARLYPVYQYLNQTCSQESEIFWRDTRMLTDKTCRVITGLGTNIFSDWTAYPIQDIWGRIATWKLSLFQLVGLFPRVPLGFAVETATIMHLLGDPIDSIACMFLTLAMCQSRAAMAKQVCEDANIAPNSPEYAKTWKGLAIFIVSYDECGKSSEVDEFCRRFLRLRRRQDFDDEIRHIYEETASCLASDRQTKTLPVVLAELFFVGGWLIALIKAGATDPSPVNWPQVEVHSVAFSGMYLWVTSAVVLGSVIGTSQTENSIPRLLQGCEYQLSEVCGRRAKRRPSALSREEIRWCRVGKDRAIYGGVNSWRPGKWTRREEVYGISNLAMMSYVLNAAAAVVASYSTAMVLSYSVIPRGPNCRHIPESIMVIFWMFSFITECFLERCLGKALFWTVFCKDTFFALSNLAIVIVTQWGIMNRCSCWSMWGSRGLNLPQMPEILPDLMIWTKEKAPWITSMAILFQMIFCAITVWRYKDAVRVYIQRDDGFSNRQWRRQSAA